MEFGSLFAGIRGFDLALTRAGMRSVYAAEREADCNSVARRLDGSNPEANQGGTVVAYQCHGSNLGPMGTLRAGNGNEAGGVPFVDVAYSIVSNGNGTDPAGHNNGWDSTYISQEAPSASEEKRDADQALRALRDQVGAEAFAEWRSGILDSLQSPEVLRSALHGCGIRRAARESGAWMDDSALPRAKDLPAGAMRRLWVDGPDGRSSFGRQLAQQLADESGAALPILSYQTPPRGVRRLMPIECERLMGFPDGWTQYGACGEEIPDAARYRMLGNAVSVPVVYWIGQRILDVHNGPEN